MPSYYVNDHAQANGDHEVHVATCFWYQRAQSCTYVGEHASCYTAVLAAKQKYWQSNGCATCSPACNTG